MTKRKKVNKQDLITSMDINILLCDFSIDLIRHDKISYVITFIIHTIIVFLISLYDKNLGQSMIFLYAIFIISISNYIGCNKEIDEIMANSKSNDEILKKLKKLKKQKGIKRR